MQFTIHVTTTRLERLRALRIFFHLEVRAFEEVGPAGVRFRTKRKRARHPPALANELKKFCALSVTKGLGALEM